MVASALISLIRKKNYRIPKTIEKPEELDLGGMPEDNRRGGEKNLPQRRNVRHGKKA